MAMPCHAMPCHATVSRPSLTVTDPTHCWSRRRPAPPAPGALALAHTRALDPTPLGPRSHARDGKQPSVSQFFNSYFTSHPIQHTTLR